MHCAAHAATRLPPCPPLLALQIITHDEAEEEVEEEEDSEDNESDADSLEGAGQSFPVPSPRYQDGLAAGRAPRPCRCMPRRGRRGRFPPPLLPAWPAPADASEFDSEGEGEHTDDEEEGPEEEGTEEEGDSEWEEASASGDEAASAGAGTSGPAGGPAGGQGAGGGGPPFNFSLLGPAASWAESVSGAQAEAMQPFDIPEWLAMPMLEADPLLPC